MDSLDDRLREILIELSDTTNHNREVSLGLRLDEIRPNPSTKAIAQIHKAFEEAGWKDVPTILDSLDKSSVTFRADEPNDVLMTGQEWYNRFEKDLDTHRVVGPLSAKEAAKRAPGIQGDASLSTD